MVQHLITYPQPRCGLHNATRTSATHYRVGMGLGADILTTGMPSALPAANNIFPLMGKNPPQTTHMHPTTTRAHSPQGIVPRVAVG